MGRPVVFSPLLLTVACCGRLPAAELSADQLFARDHIVKVEVQIPADDWRRLCDQSRGNPFGNPSEKPFSYFQGNVKIDGYAIENVGIRKKGFIGSLDDFRPSLKIKFDKYQDQQPVDQMVTMTLNNNKQDRSLLSQSLTYHLFSKAGVHAPRITLATVTVNGQYLGIYSHVESMKEPFLKREFGDASGVFYEGTLSDFYPKAVERLEPKNAKSEIDRSAALKLSELLDSEGPIDLESLESIVDVDNFLKFWAMESLVGFWDGYTQNQNNFFAYQNPKNGKFYFMPWGADGCFGDNPFRRFRGSDAAASVVAESILANRLFHTEGIPARYKATLQSILKDVWDEEELMAESERMFALVFHEFDERQFFDAHDAKDRLVEFIKGRRARIEAELENDWPVDVSPGPRIPFYFEPVGSATGDFTTTWDVADGKQDANIRLELNGSKLQFESITVVARTSAAPSFQFGRFGHPNRNPPVSVVFTCNRRNDDPLTLTLDIKREDLASKKEKTIDVTGRLQDGNQQGFRGGRRGPWGSGGRQIQGSLKMTSPPSKAGKPSPGEPFAGEFDLKLVEMRGGPRW